MKILNNITLGTRAPMNTGKCPSEYLNIYIELKTHFICKCEQQ